MSDSRRQSGRASKGQHQHRRDQIAYEQVQPPVKKKANPATKKRKDSKTKPKSEEPLDAPSNEIRCYCGNTEEEPEDSDLEDMGWCPQCDTWQHACHMNLSQAALEKLADGAYKCETCDPEGNADLITWLEHGGAPLTPEDVKKKTLMKYIAKTTGKKGRRSTANNKDEDASGSASRHSSPVDNEGKRSGRASQAAEEDEGRSAPKSAGRKRKAATSSRDETPIESTKKRGPKARKTSEDTRATPTAKSGGPKRRASGLKSEAVDADTAPKEEVTSPSPKVQAELVTSIDQLHDEARKKFVTTILRVVKKGVTQLVASGALAEAEAPSDDAQVTKSLEIEHAVYLAHYNANSGKTSPEGGRQIGKIMLNLPRNPKLLLEVVDGTISHEDLARMDDRAMATEEKKLEDAALQEKVDKQAMVLKDDSLKRIRKTHKGEEEIEGAINDPADTRVDSTIPSEVPKITALPGSPGSIQDQSVPPVSEPPQAVNPSSNSPGITNGQDTVMEDASANDSEATPQIPPPVDHDYQVSHVPDQTFGGYESPVHGNKATGDIPRPGPGQIWHGELRFSEALTAPTAGFLLATSGPSTEDVRDFMPEQVLVNARLSMDVCETYLDSILARSQQKPVYIIGIRSVTCPRCELEECKHCNRTAGQEAKDNPTEESTQSTASTDRLLTIMDYFRNKRKHGVVDISMSPRVENCYLIPLLPDPQKLPKFFNRLDKDLLSPELLSTGRVGLLIYVLYGEEKGTASGHTERAKLNTVPPIHTDSNALYAPSPPASPSHPPAVSAINDNYPAIFPTPTQANTGRARTAGHSNDQQSIPSQNQHQQPGIPHRVTNTHHVNPPQAQPPISYDPNPSLAAVASQGTGGPALAAHSPTTFVPFPLKSGGVVSIPQAMFPYAQYNAVVELLNAVSEISLERWDQIRHVIDTNPSAGESLSILTNLLANLA